MIWGYHDFGFTQKNPFSWGEDLPQTQLDLGLEGIYPHDIPIVVGLYPINHY